MEEKSATVQNFLLGIRDNLLKPMAAEIEQSTDSNSQKILENNKEMLRIMMEKMNELILENTKLREEISEKEKLQKEELLQICMKTTWEE
mgnify:CR=1 FL=1